MGNPYVMNQSVFGSRLRARRVALGFSQEALGVLIGLDESCSRARISRYELGVNEPAMGIGLLLAKALGVPLGYLYCEDELEAEALLIIHTVTQDQKQRIVEALRGCLPEPL